jgi:hypothetical protein
MAGKKPEGFSMETSGTNMITAPQARPIPAEVLATIVPSGAAISQSFWLILLGCKSRRKTSRARSGAPPH